MKSGFLNIILLVVVGAGLVLGGIGAYLVLPKAPREKLASTPVPAPISAAATTTTTMYAPVARSSPAATSTPPAAPPALPATPPPTGRLPAVSSTQNVAPPVNISAPPPSLPAPPALPQLATATATMPAVLPASSSVPQTAAAAPSLKASSSTAALPPARAIDPQTIVGIVCNIEEHYTASDPQFKPVTERGYSRGTGVIIDKRGYILTNRHVGGTFVQKATTTIGYDELTLTITSKNTGCWVGTLPQGTTLPTAQEIQTFNPTARIPVLSYTAEPLYEPSGNTFSELEKFQADFTVLKITGLSPDGPTFGVTKVPAEFPYAPLLPVHNIFRVGAPVLSYGAPADATAAKSDLFSTLYILGATGHLAKANNGDKAFADVPMNVEINMEVSGGRSGSPVFWNGYLIGIIQAHKSGNKTQTLAVASDAIVKYLRGTAGWEPAQ